MASPPSPDLTRHQLDELDALLQRMLNLPLAPAPRPAPVPPPPAPPREPIALPDNWRDEEPTPDVVPFAEPRTLRGVDAPATPIGFKPETDDDFDMVSLDAAPTSAASEEPVMAGPASVPVLLWPIAALNAVIEWALSLFGPLGAWICSPGAKTVLGVTGVAMLAAAGFWAARAAGHLG